MTPRGAIYRFTDIIQLRVSDTFRCFVRQTATDWKMSESCVIRALCRAALNLYEAHPDVVRTCLKQERDRYDDHRKTIGQRMRAAKGMRREARVE